VEHSPTINQEEAFRRSILFSNRTSKHYISVDRDALKEFPHARLRVFYEEELDVPLVLFNDVLDHVLRIDRPSTHPRHSSVNSTSTAVPDSPVDSQTMQASVQLRRWSVLACPARSPGEHGPAESEGKHGSRSLGGDDGCRAKTTEMTACIVWSR
jgi:hypothetical protein